MEKARALMFLDGACTGIGLASLYFAFKKTYIPIFGLTMGPLFFWSFAVTMVIAVAVMLWFARSE